MKSRDKLSLRIINHLNHLHQYHSKIMCREFLYWNRLAFVYFVFNEVRHVTVKVHSRRNHIVTGSRLFYFCNAINILNYWLIDWNTDSTAPPAPSAPGVVLVALGLWRWFIFRAKFSGISGQSELCHSDDQYVGYAADLAVLSIDGPSVLSLWRCCQYLGRTLSLA